MNKWASPHEKPFPTPSPLSRNSSPSHKLPPKISNTPANLPKLSGIIIEYSNPLVNDEEIETEFLKKGVFLGINFWNISFLPKKEAWKRMESNFDPSQEDFDNKRREFKRLFKYMYDRKHKLFPNETRFVLDHFYEEDDDIVLKVVSTDLSNYAGSVEEFIHDFFDGKITHDSGQPQ